MSKAVEVNEIEGYNKNLCDFCDFNITRYEMYILENNESLACRLFCEDCFEEFVNSCYDLLYLGDSEDENDNM